MHACTQIKKEKNIIGSAVGYKICGVKVRHTGVKRIRVPIVYQRQPFLGHDGKQETLDLRQMIHKGEFGDVKSREKW